jgi:acyl carrier protein
MAHTEQPAASAEAATSGTAPRGRSESIDRFVAVIGEVIGVDPVTRSEHFLDLGGDSLDAVIVTDVITAEFDTAPELDWFFESSSVEELVDRWWHLMSA